MIMDFRQLTPEEIGQLPVEAIQCFTEIPENAVVLGLVDDNGGVLSCVVVVLVPHVESMWLTPALRSETVGKNKSDVIKLGVVEKLKGWFREEGGEGFILILMHPRDEAVVRKIGGQHLGSAYYFDCRS